MSTKTANAQLERRKAKLLKLARKEQAQRAQMDRTREQIVSELRDVRQMQGMTLADINAATGFDPSTVSVIERGQTFKVDTVQKLIEVYTGK